MKRHNRVSRDESTRALDKELSHIDGEVRLTITKLSKEVENNDSPDVGVKVESKIDRAVNTLTHEMMQLAGRYHRQKDIIKIRQFLDEQKQKIQDALTVEGEDEKQKSLAVRITELHKIMADERRRLRTERRKELAKYLVTLTIALVSLLVSVYALTR